MGELGWVVAGWDARAELRRQPVEVESGAGWAAADDREFQAGGGGQDVVLVFVAGRFRVWV